MKAFISFIGVFFINVAQVTDDPVKATESPIEEDPATLEEYEDIAGGVSIWNNHNGFKKFSEAIRFRESSDRYGITNSHGYLGAYQFGRTALKDLGLQKYQTNKKAFLTDPSTQDEAFLRYCMINKFRLRNYIRVFSGRKIAGVHITESGILAAAHLVGSQSVKDWFNSRGKIEPKDAYGTSLKEYLVKFSGFNLDIEASRKGRLTESAGLFPKYSFEAKI
ncbi:hypothetical protein FUAX_14300 [Fulvitalea axinellae]|uniref:Peptidoglycan-binding protein LysM n=1 Tax=Fulvitalea axinellae TaxID=1182444 RepID=A0AAU9CG69_9BACT|nr:hypothetical protein FUAX_14300 [Fulvitalea axinellae]